MKKCLTLIVAVVAAGAFGCGGDVPKAEPKFREPPKATIGQIDDKGGVQGGDKMGGKVK